MIFFKSGLYFFFYVIEDDEDDQKHRPVRRFPKVFQNVRKSELNLPVKKRHTNKNPR